MTLGRARRRLLLAEQCPSAEACTEMLGEPLAAPGDFAPGDDFVVALVVSPATAGIVSRFHARGQLVLFGADAREIARDATVGAEFATLVDRLCFRHRLTQVEAPAAAWAPLARAVAERMGLAWLEAPPPPHSA